MAAPRHSGIACDDAMIVIDAQSGTVVDANDTVKASGDPRRRRHHRAAPGAT
jgi:hypothetical protein